MTVVDEAGRRAVGWGETPLSVPWAWPSPLPYDVRHEAIRQLTLDVARLACDASPSLTGHPLLICCHVLEELLPSARAASASTLPDGMTMTRGISCPPLVAATQDSRSRNGLV